MLTTLLLVAALICFGLAAFGVASKINLVAAGLAFYMLALLIPGLR